MYETSEVVPFIQAGKADTVAHSDRYPHRNIEVVSDQNGLPTGQLHDETLVT